MCSFMLMTMWRNWKARKNDATHGKPLPPTEGSRKFLCGYMTSLMNIKLNPLMDAVKGKRHILDFTRRVSPAPRRAPAMKVWEKPPQDWVKLNVDGSFQASLPAAGACMILRDDEGTVILILRLSRTEPVF